MTISQISNLGDRHRAELTGFALHLTQDAHQAQDLLQEAAYLAIKYRDSYRPGTNFLGWGKTIIRNTFISGYRRVKRRAGLLDRNHPTQTWISATAVSNEAESNLATQEIMATIHALPTVYRIPFLLHYRGVKYQDISRRLGIPVGTAKSRVHTARVRLRAVLGPVYDR